MSNHTHRGSIIATITCADCRPISLPSLGALVWLEEHLDDDFKAAGCFEGEVYTQYADDFGPEHRQLVQELYLWLQATWERSKETCTCPCHEMDGDPVYQKLYRSSDHFYCCPNGVNKR